LLQFILELRVEDRLGNVSISLQRANGGMGRVVEKQRHAAAHCREAPGEDPGAVLRKERLVAEYVLLRTTYFDFASPPVFVLPEAPEALEEDVPLLPCDPCVAACSCSAFFFAR
jgi:hypothetical protein